MVTAPRPASSAISIAAATTNSTESPLGMQQVYVIHIVYGIHNRGTGPHEGLRRAPKCSRASTSRSKPARCSRCSGPTAPARRRPSASSARCSNPDDGHSARRRPRRRQGPQAGPGQDQPDRAGGGRRRRPDRHREPADDGPPAPGEERQGRDERAARALRSRRCRRPPRRDLQRRDAPPPRPGDEPDLRARGDLPRRADHGPGPAQPPRGVGGRPGAGRQRRDDPAHHPVPRGGRPPRRPDRGRQRRAASPPRARPRNSRRASAKRRSS